MDKNEFIIWLYEQKDELEKDLRNSEDYTESYRSECWAKVNLLNKIISEVKKELK